MHRPASDYEHLPHQQLFEHLRPSYFETPYHESIVEPLQAPRLPRKRTHQSLHLVAFSSIPDAAIALPHGHRTRGPCSLRDEVSATLEDNHADLTEQSPLLRSWDLHPPSTLRSPTSSILLELFATLIPIWICLDDD
jgi:hypothetical protein